MKSGPRSSNRLQHSDTPAVVEVVGVVGVEANVGVEVEAEDQEIVKEIVVKETVVKEIVVKEVKVVEEDKGIILTIATKLNVILINLHSNHVFVTGPSEKVLIFVWSLAPAHGSNIGYQNLILNEIQTSSDTVKTVSVFKNFYIQQNFHK